MGVMLILNEEGDVVADIAAVPPRKGNYADREYFQVHQASAGLGLHVGRPIVSRLDGERMLPFSRRIDRPDGSFGGVVLGTVKLSYFTHLFSEIDLGPGGAINLYLTDGTRIMRYPYVEADLGANIAQAPTFRRFLREGRGSFVSTSVRDGVERSYKFTRIGTLPLILNVAPPRRTWRRTGPRRRRSSAASCWRCAASRSRCRSCSGGSCAAARRCGPRWPLCRAPTP